MKTTCPSCGAPIEFRYDDSFVRICSYCKAACARTDRGVDSLGKVADLVPIESPLRLFAEGHFGSTSFLLVGMAQIKHHAGGIWQEWYAKLDGGRWGWLAEAQGRYYLTFEESWPNAPGAGQLGPGMTVDIPVRGRPRRFTVAEVSSASYVGAMGELPYRLVPDGTFYYVDLSDGEGTFATLDYGEEGEPPALYLGRQVTIDELRITGGEVGPSRETAVKSARLACPSCNAPLELHAPGQTQRVVCSHCNAFVDTSSGTLQLLAKLAHKASPSIPLGTKGTFAEGEMTVIGYVQRSAQVDGDWWPFYEYLLHEPKLGFRWLVQSDGHWSYVQPVAIGAVETTLRGCKYDGVAFRRFQSAPLRVDEVLGEFYWKVEVGETVDSEDHIAPPAMLSRETSSSEDNWSLSTYLTPRELDRAFGGADYGGSGQGVAPNQINTLASAANWMTLGFLGLVVVGVIAAMAAPSRLTSMTAFPIKAGVPAAPPPDTLAADYPGWPADCIDYKRAIDALDDCSAVGDREVLKNAYLEASARWLVARPDNTVLDSCRSSAQSTRELLASANCAVPRSVSAPTDATADTGNVVFSDPFTLDGGRNIEIEITASTLDNNWVYVAADLVNEASGQVISVDGDLEYYSGVEDGDSWSEGSRETRAVIGPQPSGTYLLRLEGQHGGPGVESATIRVIQGVFRGKYLALAFLVLGLPFFFVGLASWSFEKKRWQNSATGKAPTTPFAILILAIGGVFTALWFLIKALMEASSNDND